MSEGHRYAGDYPIGLLLLETTIASQRKDKLIALEALAIQSAMAALLNEDSVSGWETMLKRLTHV